MKPCPIIGCTATCRDDQVMCHTHWRLVPDPLQKMIWRLWRDGKPRDGHMEAVLSAISQVNEILRARSSAPRTALNPAAAWPFPQKKEPEVTAPGSRGGDTPKRRQRRNRLCSRSEGNAIGFSTRAARRISEEAPP